MKLGNLNENILKNAFPCITCGYCRDGCVISRYYGFEPQLLPVMRLYSADQVRYKLFTLSNDLLDNLYLCTNCGYCTEVCPQTLDFAQLILKSRSELRLAGLKARQVFENAKTHIEQCENPYGEHRRGKTEWLNELDFKVPNKANTMFFVGCTIAYKMKEIAVSTAKVLHRGGIDFGVLGEQEPCCGLILLQTGFLDQAKDQAKKTLDLLKDVKEVVIACAGCYRTFKKDFPEIYGDLPFKVTHTTNYILNLIKYKKLKLNEVNMKVTYHDPCELGRHSGVYNAPREILTAIPKLELVEMDPTRHLSWCCGAGGGVKMAFPRLAVDIASEKIELALDTGTEAIVTACPLCKMNLKDAAKGNINVYSIEEIVARSLRL